MKGPVRSCRPVVARVRTQHVADQAPRSRAFVQASLTTSITSAQNTHAEEPATHSAETLVKKLAADLIARLRRLDAERRLQKAAHLVGDKPHSSCSAVLGPQAKLMRPARAFTRPWLPPEVD